MIDTHSHIDLPLFTDRFKQLLEGARQAGVTAQVLPGVTQKGWQRILSLASEERDLYPAIGLHPLYLAHHSKKHLVELRHHALAGKLTAIGEIGLDYYHAQTDRSAQQELFEKQLLIAREAALPVLLHVRKAHDQVQKTIRRLRYTGGGIVHAFSGSLQQAEHYLKLGFCISVCGTITYDRARKIRKVAQALPLDSLVVETDAPDIPPASHHGETNLPQYLPEIVETLARLRKESIAKVIQKTTQNSQEVLAL